MQGRNPANGVWLFRPPGTPKKLVIFFHGQGGPQETTPVNHVAWIDHLVKDGAAVIYPRYETDNAAGVLESAVAGVRTANERLDSPDLPVLALGYSRGGALAVEYAAVSAGRHVPVPAIVESVNPVPWGEQARIVDLRPLGHRTVMALIVSDQDPGAAPGASGLLTRLRKAGFPGEQLRLHVARSHGSFVADHLAPLGSSPAARTAYWVPTDVLLGELARSTH